MKITQKTLGSRLSKQKVEASILDSSFKISPAFFVNRTKMADEYEFYIQASVRGYHAYFKESTVHVGDILDCEMEPENDHDRYAVAVKKRREDCRTRSNRVIQDLL